MQAAAQSLASARRPLGNQHGGLRSKLPQPRGPVVQCAAGRGEVDTDLQGDASMRDKVAVMLSGVAATCLVLGAGPALAAETAAASPPPAASASAPAAAAAKPTAPPAAAKDAAPKDAAAKEAPAPAASSGPASDAEKQADLEKKNADTLKKFIADLEASKAAAVKSVEDLQRRLANEHAQLLRLQAQLRESKADLEKSKADLEDSQKEVEKERQLLVAAKKQAADAAAAAKAAEAALKGQAGLETLKSPLGIAAAAGWGLAALVAFARANEQKEWESGEGIKRLRDQARAESDRLRAEIKDLKERLSKRPAASSGSGSSSSSAADLSQQRHKLQSASEETERLRKELKAVQGSLTQLTEQLEQERDQSDTLRETILILEGEVTRMEEKMNAAKSEAFDLQRKLDEVLESGSLRKTLTSSVVPTPRPISTSTPTPSSSSATTSSSSSTSSSSTSRPPISSPTNNSGGKAVRVKFRLKQELPFGQSLKLVGSHPALGAWEEDKGPMMTWSDGHIWVTEVPLPAGTAVEFKAVRVISGPEVRFEWENGPNHVLLIPNTGASSLSVNVEWGAGTSIVDEKPATVKKEAPKPQPVAVAAAAASSSSSTGGGSSGSGSSSSGGSSSGGGGGGSKGGRWKGLLG